MNKEKLIAAMREAVYSAPTDNAENECLIGIGWERIDRVTELCAEAALKELETELERVKGLMKELHAQTWQMSGKQKDRGWAQYKEQHGI